MATPKSITVEISPGELIDKITILRIKHHRLADPAQRAHVAEELATLTGARDAQIEPSESLADLTSQLEAVNQSLWEIEDAVRHCERHRDFGPRFIELARSVYRTNDRRTALKRAINDLCGSRLVEEKSYPQYD